ncbi:MAG: hypothetical protein HY907_00245 [Deltaproteobacteria bacterium]|nr:hypothetical protein [Deltaproteobacteria bacterium]
MTHRILAGFVALIVLAFLLACGRTAPGVRDPGAGPPGAVADAAVAEPGAGAEDVPGAEPESAPAAAPGAEDAESPAPSEAPLPDTGTPVPDACRGGGETAPPAALHARIELPGPERGRHLTLDVELGTDSVRLTGCVSAVSGSCRSTHSVALGPAARTALAERWCAAAATPACRLTELRDGRPFVITWDGGELAGDLTGDGSAIEPLYGVECTAPHRLALWLVAAFGDPGPPG